MKHFKQLTFIILTLSLLLCGCGGTETNTNGNTNNNTTNSAGKNEEYTLSEFINKGETIWYATDGYGKDDKIGEIYVIEADGTLYYADCDWTLGEVEQKSDDEIVSFVKETYKKEMTASINYIMNSYHKGDRIENLDECGTIITDLSSIYTPYLENIEPATYKLSLTSDSTGNRADTEILAFKEYAPTDGDGMYTYSTQIWKIELSQIVPFESNEGATNSFNIYDSWYGGYRIENYQETGFSSAPDYEYLLTRLDSAITFKLDEIGTENIGVDNADSLFEVEEIVVEIEHDEF